MSSNTFPTASNLSAHVGKFVRFASGTRSVELNTTASTPSLGVISAVYTVGTTQYAEVVNGPDFGEVVQGDANMLAGDLFTNNASGTATKAALTSPVHGVAARDSVLGQLFQAQLFNTAGTIGGGALPSSGILTSSIIDGATLTAAAAASAIPAANVISIPANYFGAVNRTPRGLDIWASGRISSAITTPGTARFDVRLSGVAVFDGLAVLLDSVAAHATVGWSLHIRLSLRSVGAGVLATFWGFGTFTTEDLLGTPATAPKGALTAVLPWNATPAVGTGWDSTIANPLDLFFTQTVNTGSLIVHQYDVSAF